MLLKESWVSGQAKEILGGKFTQVLAGFAAVDSDNSAEGILKLWQSKLQIYLDQYVSSEEEVSICLAVAALALFLETEWGCENFDEHDLSIVCSLLPAKFTDEVCTILLADCDSLVPVRYPHLLLLSQTILEGKCCDSFWGKIWLLRSIFIQQQTLDELSPQLYERINNIVDSLDQTIIDGDVGFDRIALSLELARIHIYYGYIERAGRDIAKAAEVAQLSFEFTGALGKRTRYQANDLAQLTLNVQVPAANGESNEAAKPREILLNDDVRLEKVKFTDTEADDVGNMSSLHKAILLATLKLRMKSMPSDELSSEENMTIVQKVVEGGGSWSVQSSALLTRSHIERTGRRTVERAMLQVQTVLEEMQSGTPSVAERLKDYFISFLPTKREVELTLADFYISLGAFKSALDVCLRLQKWEMAIACYNALQLRHKAQELIEQELAKEETPKLWCLLGDATDDEKCYEKAWVLSKEKSARAQRHWANFYYQRKKYKESIEHLEKSLTINSLQINLWYRLGFAALHSEEWETSANAYRRYCVLDNECFEAWNNMARCYCELKQKRRAWRALQEALKIDHSNWRVWDNYMLVSADLKELHEVVRSYHQVLTIKPNHLDLLVLRSLVNNFIDLKSTDEQELFKKISELFGRITCQIMNEAELWVLYSELYSKDESVESYRKQRDLLLKAHRSAVGKAGWERTFTNCERVVAILERLLTVTLLCGATDGVSTIKLAANGSISIITRCYPDSDVCCIIKEKLCQVANNLS